MDCIHLVMNSLNDFWDLLILYWLILYFLIDSSNDLSLLVGMRGEREGMDASEWEGMRAAWTAWPDPGGRRGQTRRAAAWTAWPDSDERRPIFFCF